MGGEPPYWRILGRTSVDILKSGGYKISALDIENVLQACRCCPGFGTFARWSLIRV